MPQNPLRRALSRRPRLRSDRGVTTAEALVAMLVVALVAVMSTNVVLAFGGARRTTMINDSAVQLATDAMNAAKSSGFADLGFNSTQQGAVPSTGPTDESGTAGATVFLPAAADRPYESSFTRSDTEFTVRTQISWVGGNASTVPLPPKYIRVSVWRTENPGKVTARSEMVSADGSADVGAPDGSSPDTAADQLALSYRPGGPKVRPASCSGSFDSVRSVNKLSPTGATWLPGTITADNRCQVAEVDFSAPQYASLGWAPQPDALYTYRITAVLPDGTSTSKTAQRYYFPTITFNRTKSTATRTYVTFSSPAANRLLTYGPVGSDGRIVAATSTQVNVGGAATATSYSFTHPARGANWGVAVVLGDATSTAERRDSKAVKW